jgi:hypothetical protein
MNVEGKKSDPNWEAMSCSGQPVVTSQAGSDSRQPEEDNVPLLPEGAFLAAEAESARAAVVQTLRDLNTDLRDAADLRYWTRLHPWVAVGVATTAGFVVGAIANSAGAETRHPADRDSSAAERPESVPPEVRHKPATSTLWRWLSHLVSDLFSTFATALAASMVQAVTRVAAPSSPVSPPDSQEMARGADDSDTPSASAINNLGDGSGPGKTIHEP